VSYAGLSEGGPHVGKEEAGYVEKCGSGIKNRRERAAEVRAACSPRRLPPQKQKARFLETQSRRARPFTTQGFLV
jgi:hypothetical protein